MTSALTTAAGARGQWRAHRWLITRRTCQIGILVLFLLGPLAGIWVIKGNLAHSYVLDTFPLTDPYVLAQSVVAGHRPATLALIGAAIVAAFYALVGGRMYCSWVCPVNLVTDLAAWARRRAGWHSGASLSRHTRYWLLVATFVAATLSGLIVWEAINPVSMVHRAVIFGAGMAWLVVAAVFAFDLLVAPRGWCGHVCPVGAFYALLGARALMRFRAPRRDQCNFCRDCLAVCPEPQVLMPVLTGAGKDVRPTILDAACTACGRCSDVCSRDVFQLGTRFTDRTLR
ncbi:MAG: quinol dehydrogenase ferredoxin subunit NapH [Gammaproteobacteria bacterium]|nr:quinol dehydrogenase ferredoxin subunit NapH [Gammaproteobacteria bacterium]